MDATGNGAPVIQYYGCWVVDFYNDERPHEALGQDTPASVYHPSIRALPRTLTPLEYPGHFEVRRVSRNSGIRWKKHWVCVTHTLAGEYVGLEEVDDGLGCILRPAETRPDGRTPPADRRSQRSHRQKDHARPSEGADAVVAAD